MECDRIVIMTLSLAEYDANASEEVLHMSRTTIRVLKQGHETYGGSCATVLESYWSARPYGTEGTNEYPSRILEAFLAMGTGAIEAAIAQEQQSVEDLLVQMSVGAASKNKTGTRTL